MEGGPEDSYDTTVDWLQTHLFPPRQCGAQLYDLILLKEHKQCRQTSFAEMLAPQLRAAVWVLGIESRSSEEQSTLLATVLSLQPLVDQCFTKAKCLRFYICKEIISGRVSEKKRWCGAGALSSVSYWMSVPSASWPVVFTALQEQLLSWRDKTKAILNRDPIFVRV